MLKRYFILLLSILFVSIAAIQAQIYDEQGQYVDTVFHDHINRAADDFVKVSLVVAEPGGALYSIFGHACLHMICETYDIDCVFSFESEDAASRVGRFLAGKLTMGMLAFPFDDYVNDYASEGRKVTEYPLLLSPASKQKLWQVLDEQVAQGIDLPYDYSAHGCAIACVHFVHKAIAPDTITYAPWTEKQMRTRREMGYDCATKDFPWNMWFIMTLVGSDVDKAMAPNEKLIIPAELAEAWSTATVNGQPLLGEAIEVSPSTHEPYKAGVTPMMVAIVLLALVLLGWWFKFDYADYLVLIISTVIGLLVSYLVVISNLPCTNWNWLIIPFNVLPAIFWHWRKYWGVYYAGLIGLWIITMVAIPHRQVDPANMILAQTFAIVIFKQWWLQKMNIN